MEKQVMEIQKPAFASPEDRAIDPVLEEKQSVLKKAEDEKQGNEPEIAVENPESQMNSSKKIKQNVRTKQVTVPRPFSLATEKRMGRERRGSLELPSAATKAKSCSRESASLSYRTQSSTESSQPNNASARTSTKLKTPKEHIQVEKECKKLEKSSTFKASPLPSLYSRRASVPRPESKKGQVSQPKHPALAQTSKPVTSTANNKEKVSSKPISSNTKDKMNTTTPKTFNVPRRTVETVVASA